MNTRAQHVVVVDDEAPAREMVGDYLRLHGFEVTLCDGGGSLRDAEWRWPRSHEKPEHAIPLEAKQRKTVGQEDTRST